MKSCILKLQPGDKIVYVGDDLKRVFLVDIVGPYYIRALHSEHGGPFGERVEFSKKDLLDRYYGPIKIIKKS